MRTPGQNGSRERGFGTLKYERLFIDEIDDANQLAAHAEDYRIEYNQTLSTSSHCMEPVKGGTPRTRRLGNPHLRNQRHPANYLTRDSDLINGYDLIGRASGPQLAAAEAAECAKFRQRATT